MILTHLQTVLRVRCPEKVLCKEGYSVKRLWLSLLDKHTRAVPDENS